MVKTHNVLNKVKFLKDANKINYFLQMRLNLTWTLKQSTEIFFNKFSIFLLIILLKLLLYHKHSVDTQFSITYMLLL